MYKTGMLFINSSISGHTLVRLCCCVLALVSCVTLLLMWLVESVGKADSWQIILIASSLESAECTVGSVALGYMPQVPIRFGSHFREHITEKSSPDRFSNVLTIHTVDEIRG